MKKVAVIYDWIDKAGGVERMLPVFAEMYPNANFYTSYYNPQKAPWASELKITSSFIQSLPPFVKSNRVASFPFFKYAFESFDLSMYDLVISITSSFAKSVITRPETKHVCYLLTPTRYVWGQTNEYLSGITRVVTQPLITKLKKWDYIAAQRPDHVIAISHHVAHRVRKYYRRDASVIYPPFDTTYWSEVFTQSSKLSEQIPHDEYYLFVGRLEPYKRVDLLIEVFNKLQYPLIIIGTGSCERALKRIARPPITFVSSISDVQLAAYYKKARALIMPQEEEFGYTAIEALSCGLPVISYRQSAVSETVVDGKTGLFFENQRHVDLYNAIARFEKIEYNMKSLMRKNLSEQVKRFNKAQFMTVFKSAIES